jgi:hypothetical protein
MFNRYFRNKGCLQGYDGPAILKPVYSPIIREQHLALNTSIVYLSS